jgi:V8-like Glu-specific endopeptidase
MRRRGGVKLPAWMAGAVVTARRNARETKIQKKLATRNPGRRLGVQSSLAIRGSDGQMVYCCFAPVAWDSGGGKRGFQALGIMSSFRSLPFQRRWRVQRALPLWLLACVLSCVIVHGAPDAGESSIHPYLRSAEPQDRELNIFDKDGRQQVTDPGAYPYSTVGLLRWGDATCTATLVAANIVLTAADCVLTPGGELRGNTMGSAEFSLPQARGIQKTSITRVHKQADFWTKWTRNSYVLVELADDLGTAIGLLRLPRANTFAQDVPMNVQLVGYGHDGAAGECFQLCKVHFPSEVGGPDEMLHHDCDVSDERSPGSPMLIRSTNLDTYIVGIHTNAIGDDELDQATKTYPSYNDSVANRGVLGSFVQPHLSFLLQQAASSEASTSVEVSRTHGSEGSAPSSSSSRASAGSMPASAPSNRSSQADAGVGADLAPSSSSSDTTSVAAPQLGFAATAAYSCIGAVCVSWLAIILVAVRRIRAKR